MLGTYGAVTYTKKSVDKLMQVLRGFDIPNLIDATHIHSTIVYSITRIPTLELIATDISKCFLEAYPLEFGIVGSRPIEGVLPTKILVLNLYSPQLVEFQRLIHEIHNARYDFEDYTPHIALSYDIGDFQISALEDKIDKLETMVVGQFYAEPLDPHWASRK